MPFLAFMNIGATEIIVICGIILLLFGGKKIPELMRGIGKGIREFNTAKANLKTELDEGVKDAKTEDQKKPTDEGKTSSENKGE